MSGGVAGRLDFAADAHEFAPAPGEQGTPRPAQILVAEVRKSDNRADEQEQQGELGAHRSVFLPGRYAGGLDCDLRMSPRQINERSVAIQRL